MSAPASAVHEEGHRLAHALKNNLVALREAYLALRNDPANAPADMLDRMIEKHFFGGARTLEEMLDLLGVDRSPQLTIDQRTEVGALVRGITERQQYRTEKRGQGILLTTGPAAFVLADTIALGEALEAVIVNALRFSRTDAIVLINMTTTNTALTISVVDPGVGMSAEDLQQVFERYVVLGSRAPDGAPQMRGSLARVRAVIEAHQGTIAYSSPGIDQGCTCTITLPLAPA